MPPGCAQAGSKAQGGIVQPPHSRGLLKPSERQCHGWCWAVPALFQGVLAVSWRGGDCELAARRLFLPLGHAAALGR